MHVLADAAAWGLHLRLPQESWWGLGCSPPCVMAMCGPSGGVILYTGGRVGKGPLKGWGRRRQGPKARLSP